MYFDQLSISRPLTESWTKNFRPTFDKTERVEAPSSALRRTVARAYAMLGPVTYGERCPSNFYASSVGRNFAGLDLF